MLYEDALSLVEDVQWHHTFEIYPNIVTSGVYNPSFLYDKLNLQDVAGKTIADIGASNGYYSLQLAKAGAKVVAFDYRHEDCSGFSIMKKLNSLDINHHQVNVLDGGIADIYPEKFDVGNRCQVFTFN